MFNVTCSGSESTLLQCGYSGFPGSFSNHEVAGVRCVPGEYALIALFYTEFLLNMTVKFNLVVLYLLLK